MKKTLKIAAFVVLAVFAAGTAFAASPWTTETTYTKKVAGKLDFGVKNLLGGWTALLPGKLPCAKNGHKNCPGMCCIKGLGMGLVDAAVYTVGGALHVATFPIPIDVPLPDNGIQF